MNERPPFAVSQYTTYPQSFEKDVELYTQLGVEGIEVCEEKLSSDPNRARAQLDMIRESSLSLTSVQPRIISPFPHGMSTPDEPTEPADRLLCYQETIDLFSESFPDEKVRMVTTPGKAPDMNFRRAHAESRKFYRELADYAAACGVHIMFEMLSPVLMNAFGFVCTLDEGMEMIHDVDRPNFGLMLDVWHIWREPRIAPRIAALGSSIFLVHICDWPVGEPRGAADRVLPGDGLIDLPVLLSAIARTGYDGPYCLEIFSDPSYADSLWNADPAQVIQKGRAAFYQAWAEAG